MNAAKRGRVLLLAASFLAVPLCSGAGEVITLDNAFRLAVSTHEAVAMAREGLSQSEDSIKKAYSAILPKVTAEGSFTRYSEDEAGGWSGSILQPEESRRVEVRIEQPLFSGGRAMSALSQARKKTNESRLFVDETISGLIIETARAYYGVLRAGKEVEIKEAALARAEDQLEVARARLGAGTATRADVLRAEASVAGAAADIKRARQALLDNREALKRLTRADGDFDVVEPSTAAWTEGDIDRLVRIALDERSDYLRKKASVEVAEEGVVYARRNFLPYLGLEGVYQHKDQHPDTRFMINDSYYAGLTLTVPIFEGGLRKAELGEARSKQRESEFEALSLRRDIEVEVRQAVARHETMVSAMEFYEKQALFAEENYAMVFKQFSYGLARNTDVVDADATLVTAQLELANAAYDRELAALEIKDRAGLLLKEVRADLKGSVER